MTIVATIEIPEIDLPPPGAGLFLEVLEIENFRSCYETRLVFDPALTVVVGENNSGKSNLIDALRLLTTPAGRRSRYFEPGDISVDGSGEAISIEAHFSGATATQRALHMPALNLTNGRVIYGTRFQQAPAGRSRPESFAGPSRTPDADSSFRDLVQHVYLEPLRDAQRALDTAAGDRIDSVIRMLFTDDERSDFVAQANAQLDQLRGHKLITGTTAEIQRHIERLTAPVRGHQVGVELMDHELRRLTRNLRMKMAEHGMVPADLSESGLGYANLLFIATVMLELRRAKEADLTLFLVEEPEAHLHPQLQFVLLQYLLEHARESTRPDESRPAGRVQVIATTHSPNLASAAPVENVVVLRGVQRAAEDAPGEPDAETAEAGSASVVTKPAAADGPGDLPPETVEPVSQVSPRRGTKGVAVARLGLAPAHLRKIGQYLDVTRAALLFANSMLLVEGVAEAVLLPVLARECVLTGDTDEEKTARHRFHAATVIPIGSVDFEPYIRLLLTPDEGVTITDRLIVLTDRDPPLEDDSDEEKQEQAKSRAEHLREIALDCCGDSDRLQVFEASFTLEADLLAPPENRQTLADAFLRQRPRSTKTWKDICEANDPALAFYAALKKNRRLISKGEFAHDVAVAIPDAPGFVAPEYLASAIRAAVS